MKIMHTKLFLSGLAIFTVFAFTIFPVQAGTNYTINEVTLVKCDDPLSWLGLTVNADRSGKLSCGGFQADMPVWSSSSNLPTKVLRVKKGQVLTVGCKNQGTPDAWRLSSPTNWGILACRRGPVN